MHVHLRDPGATQKEDFSSGTRAAIAGGCTYIFDMPNNPVPTLTKMNLQDKIIRSKKDSICPVGFYFGTNGKNLEEFPDAWKNTDVFGLKIYCNHTTGELLVEDSGLLEGIFKAWESEKPILVHAEGSQLAHAIELAQFYGRRLHVCHISQASEVEFVRQAKKKKINISTGVTPHHLFLSEKDIKRLGPFGLVKPPMDPTHHQHALWAALDEKLIDIVESDHAPHTKEEKNSPTPPYGMPGLETTVGLLFKAVHDKKLKEQDVIRLFYENPKNIFHVKTQPFTHIELDPQKSYRMGSFGYQTKCGWSPFDGWELYGKVESVVLNGKNIVP